MFVADCFIDDTDESSCTYDVFRQVVLIFIEVTIESNFNRFGFRCIVTDFISNSSQNECINDRSSLFSYFIVNVKMDLGNQYIWGNM